METTMGKYGEVAALAELFMKVGENNAKAAQNADKTKRPARETSKKEDLDLLALLEKKRREYEAVKQFVNDQVKLNKPEEKKDDKKKETVISERNVALFLLGITPPFWLIAYLLLHWH